MWAHTGGINYTWKKIKDEIPPSIHARKKGKINKDSIVYGAAVAVALKAQQTLRGASDCQATAKAVRVKSEVDRQRVPRLC